MPDFGSLGIDDALVTLAVSLFGVTFLRFGLGVFAAIRDNVFVTSSIGAFIRSQVVGRVFPILTTAYFATLVPDLGGAALGASAAALGAAYVAETVGAIQEALSPKDAQVAADKTLAANEIGNPVPQD